MDEIKIKAYGKINLGLDVLRKREDGYHDLDMIMQLVDVYDDITITKTGEKNCIRVETNEAVLSNEKGNLAYVAAKTLMDKYAIDEGLRIKIDKRIPIAGGMAGGSADCAATLMGINYMFELGLDKNQLMEIGLGLGADVPYCILGGTAIARGIGEKLTPLPAPPQCHVVIATPKVSVSTAFVYGHIKPDEITRHPDIEGIAAAIQKKNLTELAKLIYNVMEDVTVPEYPVIKDIEEILINQGALNAIMSGSGPTVFALFDNRMQAQKAVDILKEMDITRHLYLTKFTQGEIY